ncbi:MAG: hypothetical protein ACPGVZ_12300 [Myxococcota bacterium]
MGALYNVTSWVLSLSIATLLVLIPGHASADQVPAQVLEPIEAPGDPSNAPALTARNPSLDSTIPLTRAASRRRVEEMSPRDWLASYGDVVVGRTGRSVVPTR